MKNLPWGLWRRQIFAILRLELRKNFLRKRAIPMYLLALAPAALFGAHAMLRLSRAQPAELGQAAGIYAIFFQTFYLRLAVFFGSLAIFASLFRGDILEKTLHYYFLVPVRRDVLAAGKYLAALLTTILLFSLGTALTFLLHYAAYGERAGPFFSSGPGMSHLAAYLGTTVLACLGYGAVFFFMGLYFSNPLIPAAIVLGWESIQFLLPPVLKKISVIHYLLSLCPVPAPAPPLAMLAEPTPAWITVPGLLLLTATVLVIAAYRVRRMEITYAAD